MMKISIITPSLNQGSFIERTVQSVLSQEFHGDLEYYVVDGGSSDNTPEILGKYEDRLSWVSGKDDGLADAVNKGIAGTSGEVIGWLNSDDMYRPGTLEKVADYFTANPGCKWLYGKCRIIDENDREIYKSVTRYKNLLLRNYSYNRLLTENYISQPAVFFRRSLIRELGMLRTDLRFAMDYDLWLRFGRLYPAGVIPAYLSDFRRHAGSLSEIHTASQFDEQYNVAGEHGASKFRLCIHKFNVKKIIWGYRALSLIRR